VVAIEPSSLALSSAFWFLAPTGRFSAVGGLQVGTPDSAAHRWAGSPPSWSSTGTGTGRPFLADLPACEPFPGRGPLDRQPGVFDVPQLACAGVKRAGPVAYHPTASWLMALTSRLGVPVFAVSNGKITPGLLGRPGGLRNPLFPFVPNCPGSPSGLPAGSARQPDQVGLRGFSSHRRGWCRSARAVPMCWTLAPCLRGGALRVEVQRWLGWKEFFGPVAVHMAPPWCSIDSACNYWRGRGVSEGSGCAA